MYNFERRIIEFHRTKHFDEQLEYNYKRNIYRFQKNLKLEVITRTRTTESYKKREGEKGKDSTSDY